MEFLYIIVLATNFLCGNQPGSAIKEGLVQLNDCVCPQYKLSFECSVLGGDFTFWKGTLFNCPTNNNRIILRHDEFSNQEESASGDCNNGAVVAKSRAVDANNRCYTSQLSIEPVTQDMDNQTIVCINEDESDETNHTITLRLTRDSLPSPTNIHLRNFNQSELTFAWDAVLTNCIAIHYRIITSNISCGHCPTTTTPNTFITCTNPNTNGDTCRFSVQPVVCGNIRGNESKPLYISPRVLDPPDINTLPKVFCSNQTMTLDLSFNKIVMRPFNISNGIDGSAISYTVTYSEATSGNICGSAVIPTSLCDDTLCRYPLTLDLSSSCLSSTRSVSVTAFATNIIGNGPSTVPVILVVPQCDDMENSGSGLTAAISVYSILLLLAGISIAILITVLVVLVRERIRLCKELEAAKEFSTYEDVDIPQFSNEAPKGANIDTDKNISYCPVSRSK